MIRKSNIMLRFLIYNEIVHIDKEMLNGPIKMGKGNKESAQTSMKYKLSIHM